MGVEGVDHNQDICRASAGRICERRLGPIHRSLVSLLPEKKDRYKPRKNTIVRKLAYNVNIA